MKNNRLTKIMFGVGVIMVVLTMILLVGYRFLPVEVIKVIPLVIGLLLGLFMVIAILQMLTSKQMMTKLAALPMLLSFFVVAFFLIKLPVYQMLMESMTGEVYEVDPELLFVNMKVGFSIFQIGIWISIIPIVIAALVLNKNRVPKHQKT